MSSSISSSLYNLPGTLFNGVQSGLRAGVNFIRKNPIRSVVCLGGGCVLDFVMNEIKKRVTPTALYVGILAISLPLIYAHYRINLARINDAYEARRRQINDWHLNAQLQYETDIALIDAETDRLEELN